MREGSGSSSGLASAGYGTGRLRARASHPRVATTMVFSSAVAGPSASPQATNELSQTCISCLEPTPGIEPETSFLPTISLPALWHTPGDPERNASNYGALRFPGPRLRASSAPGLRHAHWHASSLDSRGSSCDCRRSAEPRGRPHSTRRSVFVVLVPEQSASEVTRDFVSSGNSQDSLNPGMSSSFRESPPLPLRLPNY